MTFGDLVRKALGLRTDDDWLRRELEKFKLRAPCDHKLPMKTAGNAAESQIANGVSAVPESAPVSTGFAGAPASTTQDSGAVSVALERVDPIEAAGGEPMRTVRWAGWRRAEDTARICCQRMKQARVYSGFTLEQASERIGYDDESHLTLIENGERAPPMWVLIKAATVYPVPMDYLLGRVDEAEAGQNDYRQAVLLRHMEAQMPSTDEQSLWHQAARKSPLAGRGLQLMAHLVATPTGGEAAKVVALPESTTFDNQAEPKVAPKISVGSTNGPENSIPIGSLHTRLSACVRRGSGEENFAPD
jgi:transcriptional regulator with XRE-family HTH domain